MPAPRLIVPGATYLITRRTIRRHHLLPPTEAVRNILVYCLALAAARTGVVVHVAVAMSTHIHLVVSDPLGCLPKFLQYFHRHIALPLKCLHRWEGPVWDPRPTSVVELRTPEAVIEKCAYAIVNPVEAGLVKNAHAWTGLTTRARDLGNTIWRALRPEHWFRSTSDQWPSEVRLPVAVPPAARQLGVTDSCFRELVANEVVLQERQSRQRVRARGWTVAANTPSLRSSPTQRARSWEPPRDRNPTFAVGRGMRAALLEAVERVRAFRRAYRQRLEEWRHGGRTASWPTGTWLMCVLHGARSSAPIATEAA